MKHSLDKLYQRILQRIASGDPASSHTAALLHKGKKQIAKKLGEEAVEAALEGTLGNRKKLVKESADVLYHLLVLWAANDIKPEKVWLELDERSKQSGISEKASRKG